MILDRIVLGLDFTSLSVAAAEWVSRDLAPTAELVLVHVVATSAGANIDEGAVVVARSQARARLRALAASLDPSRVRTEVRAGDPARQIADVAGEYGADLIVVGPHEASHDRPDRLGTTAQRLVACSPLPVLLVAGKMSGAPLRLLVPVEGGDLSAGAFAWAEMLERQFDATVAIVHVAHAGGSPRAVEAPLAEPRWRQLIEARAPAKVFVDAVEGDTPAVVATQAARFASDLVVVDGPPGDLLRTATLPVLVAGGLIARTTQLQRGHEPSVARETRR